MASRAPNFLADGNINPSVFVTMNGVSGDNRVLSCGANQKIVGISQDWTKAPPISGASGVAAAAGDPITVYGQDDECLLLYGSATITRGMLLKSDANGAGVPITGTTVQNYGARALESGIAGELHNVEVFLGQATAPAS